MALLTLRSLVEPGPPAAALRLVQVIGFADTPIGGDIIIRDRLLAAGHTVTLRSDEDPELTSGFDGYVICPSCSSGVVGAKYAAAAVPGLVLDEALLDEHGMAGSLTIASVTDWTVTESGALDADLVGLQTVYSEFTTQNGVTLATLGAGAVVVATRSTTGAAATYFVYPAGSTLVGGTPAPGRRVGFLLVSGAEPNLTATGLALFDAAIAAAFPSPAVATGRGGAFFHVLANA